MTIQPDFRHLARQSLARAKVELVANDPDRLRYAALELRFAMEALTYDRALAFRDDIPPEQYKTWQPRKLMGFLLGIDPKIGMTATIAIGLESEYGKPPPREQMQVLDTDHALSLESLKVHYDATGNYLHMPSLDQVQSGALPDLAKLRSRCEAVVTIVETVLASRVWNSTLGNYATLDQCSNEDCKKPIKRRFPLGAESMDVQCFACNAEYTVTSEADHRVLWTPKMSEVRCCSCPETIALWPHEVRPGSHWRCRACDTHNTIALAVVKADGGEISPKADSISADSAAPGTGLDPDASLGGHLQ